MVAVLDVFKQKQLDILKKEAAAEKSANDAINRAKMDAANIVAQSNIIIATNQANADVANEYLVADGRAYVAQQNANVQVVANGLLSAARLSANSLVNGAQTSAAQRIAQARIDADNSVTAARIAADKSVSSARVAAEQAEADSRQTVETLTSQAEVAAVYTTTTAQITGRQLDWDTRVSVATLISQARITTARTESTARVNTESAASVADIAALQTTSTARVSARSSTSLAEIAASTIITTAQIAAASLRADGQIAVANIGRDAAIYVATRAGAGDVDAANLDPADRVADIDLQATKYDADQSKAGRIYSSGKDYAGGVYGEDRTRDSTQYQANSRYSEAVYSSDRESAASNYVAVARANAEVYVSDSQLAGANLTTDRQYARYLSRVQAADYYQSLVWPFIEEATEPQPLNPDYPGFDPDTPGIDAEFAVEPDLIESGASETEALIDGWASIEEGLSEDRLSFYGHSNTPLSVDTLNLNEMYARAVELESRADYQMEAARANSKQQASYIEDVERAMAKLNEIRVAAEANRLARMSGFLGVMPKLTSVSQQ